MYIQQLYRIDKIWNQDILSVDKSQNALDKITCNQFQYMYLQNLSWSVDKSPHHHPKKIILLD